MLSRVVGCGLTASVTAAVVLFIASNAEAH